MEDKELLDLWNRLLEGLRERVRDLPEDQVLLIPPNLAAQRTVDGKLIVQEVDGDKVTRPIEVSADRNAPNNVALAVYEVKMKVCDCSKTEPLDPLCNMACVVKESLNSVTMNADDEKDAQEKN